MKIKKPINVTLRGPKGSKVELKFTPKFVPKWTRRYTLAQMKVDSDVLRYCDKFIPLKTGNLRNSGINGTDVGSGTVKWIAPYARKQYYQGRPQGANKKEPLRGRYWFARMKEVLGDTIIKAAKGFMRKE